MANISDYDNDATITGADKILGTDAADGSTKNFTLSGIAAFLTTDGLVDLSTAQTLTNKTIDADNNTITNLAHGSEVDNPSSGVHGVTGSVVGTTDSQTLSNKVIDGSDNTIGNLQHGNQVDNPSSGVHGVTGSVVGTTDSQTLSNKVIDGSDNTIGNLQHGNQVDNPTSGVHGVTGSVVGTTDSQVLTNKSLDFSSAGTNIIVSHDLSGWGNYSDTQYTSSSVFSLAANTDTVLPNNSGTALEDQVPSDVGSFGEVVLDATSGLGYDHTKITGREGDGILITIDCKCTPTSVLTTYIEFWFDIGGSVGELYRRIISFPKGNGVLRPINFTVSGYTLDNWQTNGATVYVRANGTAELYDIRYVVTRTHKVFP